MIKRLKTALAPLLIYCLSSYTRAVVIYTDIPDTGVFGPIGDAFFDVDLNRDNTVDFRFRSNFAPGDGFVVLPQGVNTVFSTTEMPPNIGTFALDFAKGEIIGPSALGASNTQLTGISFPDSRPLGPLLLGCALFSELVCLGEFDLAGREGRPNGESEFLGVALDLNGNTHFGYVEVLNSGFNGGTIRSFAFETDPATPIIAGAVPEPSRVLLICFALVFGIVRRSRK